MPSPERVFALPRSKIRLAEALNVEAARSGALFFEAVEVNRWANDTNS